MLADNLNALLVWLELHPLSALLFVFLVAFSESLLIVGLIMPGAALMLGFGALIALGALQAEAVLIAAILGAISGDGLSYWLGWHYKQALKTRWPFAAYPSLFQQGEKFFHRHGGKSVMLGRFIGPLRPVVPAIAGMLAMSRSRFIIINIISACLWAPLYLLPGYLFGLSVEVASEFAGRFLLLFAMLIGLIWFIVFFLRQLYLLLLPYSDRFFSRLIIWSRQHPLAGEIPAAIINPKHHEVRGLSLLALILLLSTSLLIFLYEAIDIPLFSNSSLLIQNAILELHNPPFDKMMLALAQLATPAPALLSAGIILLALSLQHFQQHTLFIRHLLAVPVFPMLLMLLPESSHSLFSPAVILAISIYGFLFIALTHEINNRWRIHIYTFGTSLFILIMLARFYPGQISLLQLLTEVALISILVSALGIAYRRHHLQSHPEFKQQRLLIILFLVPGLYLLIVPASSTPAYKHEIKQSMTVLDWLDNGWRSLDSYRHDLRDNYRFPMNLQWAGSLSLIQTALTEQGWQHVDTRLMQYFNWFKTSATLIQLPIPPHVHNGHYETLAMMKYSETKNEIQIIRFWPAPYQLINVSKEQHPLWLGSVSHLQTINQFGIRYLRSRQNFSLSPQQIGLQKNERIIVKQRKEKAGWDGKVLLILEP
ncbi:DedA protein [hydrothermal vent metagenome]|uniref:DedA protein n=1 Tax=hydrothermal vent metagenome TaxID=652676 RepID=A0A3B1B7Q8_9ZZZZ